MENDLVILKSPVAGREEFIINDNWSFWVKISLAQ